MTECKGEFWIQLVGMFMGRFGALIGAIAGGLLCGALACDPAWADYYAFGDTQDDGYVELTLVEGSSKINLYTDGFQGWVANNAYGIGGPNGTNTNYIAGLFNGSDYKNYFGFNLAGQSSGVRVTSAYLTVYSGVVTNNLQYTLFAATEWISDIEMGSPASATFYSELTSGANYGSFQLLANTGGAMVDPIFTLDSSAVGDINTAITNQAMFALAGEVGGEFGAAAPEPSTWIMMLAGFAGLGVAAHRRAARRRAAASA